MTLNASAIALTFGIFFLVLSIFLACLRLWQLTGNPAMFTFLASPPATAIPVVSTIVIEVPQGLDDSTINTFPKLTYYEMKKNSCYNNSSGNIEDPSNSSCSICLADYKEEDMLRLLPDCGHLYHLLCVDLWLKSHNTCPICRTPINPSSVNKVHDDVDDRSNNNNSVVVQRT